jgi:DNA adenine methylase
LKGEFNVPYGRPKNDNRPTAAHLKACATLLTKANLHCGDFEDIVRKKVKKDDVVYLDPPFALTSKRVFREYDCKSFSPDDVDRLLSLLRFIDSRGAHFVLSYAHTAKTTPLFKDWPSHRIFVQRNISGFASFRRKSVELVVSNREFPEEFFK